VYEYRDTALIRMLALPPGVPQERRLRREWMQLSQPCTPLCGPCPPGWFRWSGARGAQLVGDDLVGRLELGQEWLGDVRPAGQVDHRAGPAAGQHAVLVVDAQAITAVRPFVRPERVI